MVTPYDRLRGLKTAYAIVVLFFIAAGTLAIARAASADAQVSRIQTWVDDGTDVSADAYGGPTSHTIPTPVVLSVPTGKTYYYVVTYTGGIRYNYGERANGATGFYGAWSANLLADGVGVSVPSPLIQTGYRQSWNSVGGDFYWQSAYQVTWQVRLAEGTHSLDIQIIGTSDGSMIRAHFQHNQLQVMRIP
jgi:hypothetical protein